MTSRRDFIKGMGTTAAISALYSRDLVAELIASAPSGRVLESKFKGISDIALAEAKLAGCTYADVRFTMSTNPPGASANFRAEGESADGRGGRGGGRGGRGAGGAGGGGGGGFGGGRGGRGAAPFHGIPTDEDRVAAGFGVRVVHSGVWGFASSPIVTEDEIRRITRLAVEVAKASAIAKKSDLTLAEVPKYVENYVTPMTKPPLSVSQTDKQNWAQAIVDKAKAVKNMTTVTISTTHGYEWRYFASSEGSYIEQKLYTTTPTMSVTAKVGDVTRTRNYPGVAAC